ncbi:MAG TPA: sensor histidine kinase [Leptospiraceae bacterium]|nr:sensor histidine kinase [Leptospiraceae bacterium]HMW04291.1 sensor histidine kinase [Leptospiraceae bacterium]HMX30637.1 sensor histidine kinase [Leptospiraceae bacterium]HMY31337.1 sensor histidine kinase [Leptospiraceae bacterium]HMZ63626.1 sensor histidine kinase [Leptospiraceae bacterium]
MKIPKVEKGVLDLSSLESVDAKDFISSTPISIDGEWEFYWKEFYAPSDFLDPNKQEEIEKNREYLQSNSRWNGSISNAKKETAKGEGFATYRMRLIHTPKEITHLKLSNVYTSYRIYINGVLLHESGLAGKDKESSKAYVRDKIVKLPDSKTGQFEILFHVSNYFHRLGGLVYPMFLQSESFIYEEQKKEFALALFFTGSFLLMSIYHFGLYLLRTKDLSPLYFGIITLLLGIRPLVTENFILDYFPFLEYGLVKKIEYFTIYLTAPVIGLFFQSVFYKTMNRKIIYGFVFISSLFCFVVLFFPVRIFSETLISFEILVLMCSCFILYSILKAALQNEIGSKTLLIGFGIFFITVVNDILHQQGIIYTGNLVPFGFYIFIVSQAYLLSVRFSNAYREEERAKEEAERQKKYLADAKKEIENLSKTKDEFLANLSHEIKTPLSIVYAYSQMLPASKENPKKIEKYADQIYSNASKLNDYVSDLLLVTDIESNLELQKRETDFNQILKESMDTYRDLVEQKSIQVEYQENESIYVNCDELLLKKSIQAVYKNAIVYNRHHGKIKIFVEKKDNKLELQIEDTGIGIAKEFQERIFEKFFRIDSSLNYETSGVGIGLFLAKKILEMHLGSIHVESELGVGTKFTIQIPILNTVGVSNV